MRGLAGRHRGPLPFPVIARIWREIIAASTNLQHPLSVAVLTPDDQPGIWDLARDYFGSSVPMTGSRSVGQVIRAVTDGTAAVGVLTFPLDAEPAPWWPQLISRAAEAPRAIARLPFGGRGNARPSGDAVVIAGSFAGAAATDRSLWAIEMPPETSRTRLTGCLSGSGFVAGVLAETEGAGGTLALIEIEGTPETADRRFAALLGQLGLPGDRLHALGGYAAPHRP
jgi:hypothetical protein